MKPSFSAARQAAAAIVLTASILVSSSAPAAAQTSTQNYDLTPSLSVPAATESALSSGDGLAWDQFRKNGLDLSMRGNGEVSLVMFVLTVEDSRVVDRWQSSRFDAAPGLAWLSGKFLPAVHKVRVRTTASSKQPIDVAEVLNARDVSAVLPRELRRGRTQVIFAAPEGGLPGSRSAALFANLEKVID